MFNAWGHPGGLVVGSLWNTFGLYPHVVFNNFLLGISRVFSSASLSFHTAFYECISLVSKVFSGKFSLFSSYPTINYYYLNY